MRSEGHERSYAAGLAACLLVAIVMAGGFYEQREGAREQLAEVCRSVDAAWKGNGSQEIEPGDSVQVYEPASEIKFAHAGCAGRE